MRKDKKKKRVYMHYLLGLGEWDVFQNFESKHVYSCVYSIYSSLIYLAFLPTKHVNYSVPSTLLPQLIKLIIHSRLYLHKSIATIIIGSL